MKMKKIKNQMNSFRSMKIESSLASRSNKNFSRPRERKKHSRCTKVIRSKKNSRKNQI